MKIYMDEFKTEKELTDRVKNYKASVEQHRTSIGVPAPSESEIIKHVAKHGFEWVGKTREQERIENDKLKKDQLENQKIKREKIEREAYEKKEAARIAEKKEAQKTPSKKYKTFRKEAYPPISDQLDMFWHAMNNGEFPKVEPFYSKCKAVKEKFKKPSESNIV